LRTETIGTVAGTAFEHDLADHARSLLNFLPISAPSGPTRVQARIGRDKAKKKRAGKASKVVFRSRLNTPGNRLAIGRVIGGPGATIFLETQDGPAAKEVERLRSTLSGQVNVETLGTPTSPKAESGTDLPGVLIEDWRPGRSVGHVDGTAGTLGVFVEFNAKKGQGLQLLRGFTTASHVLTLNVTARNGSDILSPGPPDVNRDPGTYLAGALRSWCRLVHYADSNAPAPGNLTDIAFVEMEDPVNYPARNRVPSPANPERKFLELEDVATREDVELFKLGTHVFKFGRTTGFTRGILHSAMAPYTIKLVDNRSYLYGNLYFVRPEDTGTGFSAPGDSGAAVYNKDGILIAFVVGQANEGSLVQLAAPCLAFAGAQLANVRA
jgi:hypothetical protein